MLQPFQAEAKTIIKMEAFLGKCIPLLSNYSDELSEIFKCIYKRQDEILAILENHLDAMHEKEEEVFKDENIIEADEEKKVAGAVEHNFFQIRWPKVRNKARHQILHTIYEEYKYVLNQAYANLICLMDSSTKKFLRKLIRYQEPIKLYTKKYAPEVLNTCTIEDVLQILAKFFGHLYYIDFIRETNYPQFALDSCDYKVKDEDFRETFSNQLFAIHSYSKYVEEFVREFLKDDNVFMKHVLKLHSNMFGRKKIYSCEQLKKMCDSFKIVKEELHKKMIYEYKSPYEYKLGSIKNEIPNDDSELEFFNKLKVTAITKCEGQGIGTIRKILEESDSVSGDDKIISDDMSKCELIKIERENERLAKER